MAQITSQTVDERTLVSFDWAMKNILREKSNFDVLEGFLTALLGEEIQIISLLESEANQQYELDKYNRVDLLALDANKSILVIEIQYTWQASYLKRLLYAASKLVVENIKLGDSYEKVHKVISVSILYFPFTYEAGDEQDYLYHGKTEFYGVNTGMPLRVDMADLPKADQSKAEKTEIAETTRPVNIFPEYYLIEVEHFQNLIRHPIDEWVYLFKNSEVRDDFHSKNIQAARDKLMLLHMSQEERAAYESFQLSRASALDVMAGQYKEGVKQGIEQGIEIGKEEGKLAQQRQMVQSMVQHGETIEKIKLYTGLHEDEIAALGAANRE